MVNENRLLILNKLKQSDDWLSGEQISRETGISRVAKRVVVPGVRRRQDRVVTAGEQEEGQ